VFIGNLTPFVYSDNRGVLELTIYMRDHEQEGHDDPYIAHLKAQVILKTKTDIDESII
jgi:hypothetical protein